MEMKFGIMTIIAFAFVSTLTVAPSVEAKNSCAVYCDKYCKKRVASGTAVAGYGRCLQKCLFTQQGGKKCD